MKCSGRLQSVGIVVKKEVEHSHAPNPAYVYARKIVQEVKRSARDTAENPQNIVANVCSDVSAVVISQLPEFANLKRLVRLERNRVGHAYEEILKTAFYSANQDSLTDILDYMESVWVGKMMRGGRRKSPLYSLEIWNQNVNAREGLHKTNNCVESWHNSFNKLLGSCHPTVWKIIDAFKKEQTLTEIKVVQLRSGHIKQRKKVVVTKEKRIQSVLENYHKESVMETINGICYNILD